VNKGYAFVKFVGTGGAERTQLWDKKLLCTIINSADELQIMGGVIDEAREWRVT
jgi:hypothetical protein